jgi:predicted nucleic acid-binding protein
VTRQIAIVDTGPLFAAADPDAPMHKRCAAILRRGDITPVVPVMVIAEATYFIESRIGPKAEAAFLRGITELEIESPTAGDWVRIAELVEQYADLELGGTDASVVATAERLNAPAVITLDRKHFSVVRPRHVDTLTLLPE